MLINDLQNGRFGGWRFLSMERSVACQEVIVDTPGRQGAARLMPAF
jgi:hypothetical protein